MLLRPPVVSRSAASASVHELPLSLPPRFRELLTGSDARTPDPIRARLLPKLVETERAHTSLLLQLGAEPSVQAERARSRARRRPAIHPPLSGEAHEYFTKQLHVHGVPIRAPSNCSDAALFVAADRIGRMLRGLPSHVHTRLQRRGAVVHIVGRRQQVSNLPEHSHLRGRRGDFAKEALSDPRRTTRHGVWAERSDDERGYRLPLLSAEQLTIDERTRGMGGLLCSCGEENLIAHDDDPRYSGRDILSHEFAHTLMDYGFSAATRSAIVDAFEDAASTRGLWRRPDGSRAYAATCAEEYWAE